jgi:RimJ/RimL family protein N-acetyltransferase
MTSSAFSRPPVIETPRLILREQAPSDLDAMCALWSDPAVYRFIGGQPRPREDVWRRLLANAGTWSLLGYGSWAIETRHDGRYVGSAGLLEALRRLEPAFPPQTVEAGWATSPAVHGQGLAFEAMQAIADWADTNLPQRPLVCMIAPENAPSIRLAGRLGFREYARTTYAGDATVLLQRSRRDV